MNASRSLRFRTGAVVALLVATLLSCSGGCRLCSNCEIDDYSAYGGAWERTRRDGGRVGSLYDPAGVQSDALANRDAPPSADELERQKQADSGEPSRDLDRSTDSPEPEESEEDRLRREMERDRELDELKLEDIEISYRPKPALDMN